MPELTGLHWAILLWLVFHWDHQHYRSIITHFILLIPLFIIQYEQYKCNTKNILRHNGTLLARSFSSYYFAFPIQFNWTYSVYSAEWAILFLYHSSTIVIFFSSYSFWNFVRYSGWDKSIIGLVNRNDAMNFLQFSCAVSLVNYCYTWKKCRDFPVAAAENGKLFYPKGKSNGMNMKSINILQISLQMVILYHQ